jgi:hypothetical protein
MFVYLPENKRKAEERLSVFHIVAIINKSSNVQLVLLMVLQM